MVPSLGIARSSDSTVAGLHSCMAVRGMIWRKNTNRYVLEKGGQDG